jgi:periplasmic protein TonB
MNAESILHAEMLDIIFENRNKEYGAYELRKRYGNRLKIAMEIMSLAVLTFCLILSFDDYFFHHSLVKIHVFEFTDINLSPTSISKVLEIAKPKTAKSPSTSLKTLSYTNFRIVSAGPVRPIPTVDEIAEAQIDIQSKSGELPVSDLKLPSGNGKGSGKDPKSDSPAAPILEISQIMPEFPGGMAALQKFLHDNLHSPQGTESGGEVKVLEKFVVDERGNISNIRIIRSGGVEFDNEVSRVLRKMPTWKPGKQNGVSVSVYFTIPVIFQGQDEN